MRGSFCTQQTTDKPDSAITLHAHKVTGGTHIPSIQQALPLAASVNHEEQKQQNQ